MQGHGSSSWLRGAPRVAVVFGLVGLVGIAVGVWHPWRSSASAGDFGHPASVRSVKLPGAPVAAPGSATPQPLRPPPAGADRTPTAAVTAYLLARSRTDAGASYALLSPASRRTYLSEAGWLDALPDLPPPVAFAVTGEKSVGGSTQVTVDVRRTPTLNSFVGFVPAHAAEVYRAESTAAGWRVDAEPVSVRPELAPDGRATADVTAWLARVAACDGAGAAPRQVSPDLLGDDSLPGMICSTHARLTAGAVQPMVGTPATAPFLAAFGPDLGGWARLVPVVGPGRQLLVGVAPLGSSWRVFGIVSGGIS